ncbi:MAG: extracellular solute-binding protein, partial [Alphaproteobacteria bacterium]|nr:extracellular solute-binding protein [Alphaproteobacteria bacterium]
YFALMYNKTLMDEAGVEIPPEDWTWNDFADWLRAMAAKLESEQGRALYRLRQQTVEPVFGIIKAVLGFTGFSLRGLDKVAGEWDLVALAYNCKRLHKLKLEMVS